LPDDLGPALFEAANFQAKRKVRASCTRDIFDKRISIAWCGT
jgi:hypothetical protein